MKGRKLGGKMQKVMGEFKRHALHSGSKHGPKVKSRKQAIARARISISACSDARMATKCRHAR